MTTKIDYRLPIGSVHSYELDQELYLSPYLSNLIGQITSGKLPNTEQKVQINEPQIKPKLIESPFFKKAKIDFITQELIPAERLWINPDSVKEFLIDFISRIDGQVTVYFVKDTQGNEQHIYSMTNLEFPYLYKLNVLDLPRVLILLNQITLDYCPIEIQDEFNELLNESTDRDVFVGHVNYELQRFQEWIKTNGGRTLKDELVKRFGFEKIGLELNK